ncbi:MAG: hypothetical protein IRZ16_00285 [Myxococcaceae bacterium]|nr:hypothetical protein [Myxococcaceae bacterium]
MCADALALVLQLRRVQLGAAAFVVPGERGLHQRGVDLPVGRAPRLVVEPQRQNVHARGHVERMDLHRLRVVRGGAALGHAFQNPDVRFININVAELDAHKHAALPLVGDAKVTLAELAQRVGDYHVSADYAAKVERWRAEWDRESERIFNLQNQPLISQGEVIGLVHAHARPEDVVVCAAGSLPGDLHKLWRTRQPSTYHVEYGYSCMGYEIAAGLGVKLAAPEREVFVMVGDGSYLMMAQEIITAVQEGLKLIIVLLDNHGFASIGGLSASLGSVGFGTRYRFRGLDGQLSGEVLPVDLAANAASMGAHVIRANTRAEIEAALKEARSQSRATVIAIETNREARVGSYESSWDVPVAEVSTLPEVRNARAAWEEQRQKERHFFQPRG